MNLGYPLPEVRGHLILGGYVTTIRSWTDTVALLKLQRVIRTPPCRLLTWHLVIEAIMQTLNSLKFTFLRSKPPKESLKLGLLDIFHAICSIADHHHSLVWHHRGFERTRQPP